jgi:transketolase
MGGEGLASWSYVPYAEFERLKRLSASRRARAEAFATACRINALYMIKRAGSGHIGTSFSCMDVVTWLYLEELRSPVGSAPGGSGDVYFSSKGHDAPALYAVMTGLGMIPFDYVHRLRRLGGLPGHPDVATPHVAANTGSLGMGISKAKGFVLANRLRGAEGRVYVLTGDGELQEGQIWESLQSAANLGMGEITVIVDHNKMQSDTWVAEVGDLGDVEGKFRSFGWHTARCDGHDFDALAVALSQFKAIRDRPKVLIADTIKGRGVSFMEHTSLPPGEKLYRFHSGAPDDEAYDKALAELRASADRLLSSLGEASLGLDATAPAEGARPKGQRLVAAYSRALMARAAEDPKIVVLDADLMVDCGLLPFKEKFPQRFFECGIAEQDMVSQAGAMALKGLLPLVHSFACFLSARPNEQVYNNATEGSKVVYVASLAGLLPAGPGHSHQAVRDISALAAVPGLVMLQPSCEAEVGPALDFCLSSSSSSYLRLTSIPWEVPFTLPADYRLEFGRGVELTRGDDAVLLGHGPLMLGEAYRASRLLSEVGVGLKVINLPWLNRLDPMWLREVVEGKDWLFTLDDHYVDGGQGQMVLSRLAQLRLPSPPRARQFGLTEVPGCGTPEEVLRRHRLDAASLAEDIASTFGVKTPVSPRAT